VITLKHIHTTYVHHMQLNPPYKVLAPGYNKVAWKLQCAFILQRIIVI